VLLTAAESAAHTPSKGSGAYWFTHFQTGRAIVVTGRAGRDGSTTHYFGEKDLGTRPIGAANVAAWRRDGSPAKWIVPIPGDSPGHISTTAGPWEIHKEQTAFNKAFSDGSLEELRALPTDPGRAAPNWGALLEGSDTPFREAEDMPHAQMRQPRLPGCHDRRSEDEAPLGAWFRRRGSTAFVGQLCPHPLRSGY
jgi:hypothetical protein